MDSRTQACDVAIVDIFVSGGSGLGVLQHMAGYERPPERVVVTNYATQAMTDDPRAGFFAIPRGYAWPLAINISTLNSSRPADAKRARRSRTSSRTAQRAVSGSAR